MRVFVLLLLSVNLFASGAAQAQGTSSPSYTPPTYAPPTWTPQTFAPQTHAPQTWSPQTGDNQNRSRRRLVKCMMSDDREDFCLFYSDRDFRRGSPCSCGNGRGSTN